MAFFFVWLVHDFFTYIQNHFCHCLSATDAGWTGICSLWKTSFLWGHHQENYHTDHNYSKSNLAWKPLGEHGGEQCPCNRLLEKSYPIPPKSKVLYSVRLPLNPWTATKVSKTKGSSHADWPLRVLWGSFCCVEQSRSFFCHPILSNSNLHALLGSHPSSTKVPCDELLEFLDLCDYFLDLITATFHACFRNLWI